MISSRWRIILAIAVLLVGTVFALLFRNWMNAPLSIGGKAVTFEIHRGDTFASVADSLAEQGLLTHPRWLKIAARLSGADSRMNAGEYSLEPGLTPRGLLRKFSLGRTRQHSVTLVEGWTFRDVRRALEREEPLRQTLTGRSDAEVMAMLGEKGRSPEGLFFPDTYVYGKSNSDRDILRQARQRMQAELAKAWDSRASDIPIKSDYEALVLASIIEKETASTDERSRIAGVFSERLRIGMRLQTDPTVIYGLGATFNGNLRRADLERDTPYNTYTRAGLPPTPIAMPGRDALQAAVHPDMRGELYFVAKGIGDGTHQFSKTLAQHERAVQEYVARYRARQGRASK
jgi:UPF0755 protein